jgi:hypothetical protein
MVTNRFSRKVYVFWEVTSPCSLADRYHRFGATCRHLQGVKVLSTKLLYNLAYPERTILLNLRSCCTNGTVLGIDLGPVLWELTFVSSCHLLCKASDEITSVLCQAYYVRRILWFHPQDTERVVSSTAASRTGEHVFVNFRSPFTEVS